MEGLSLVEEEWGMTQNVESDSSTKKYIIALLDWFFLFDKLIRAHIMKDKMFSIGRLGKWVTITPLKKGRYLFQFYHRLDV